MTPLYVSPRFGNDALMFGYNGVWGSLSTWVDAKGERWLMVPMMGPPAKETRRLFRNTDGKVVNGSVMAFKVKKKDGKPVLEPVWMSGRSGLTWDAGDGERCGLGHRHGGPRARCVPAELRRGPGCAGSTARDGLASAGRRIK